MNGAISTIHNAAGKKVYSVKVPETVSAAGITLHIPLEGIEKGIYYKELVLIPIFAIGN